MPDWFDLRYLLAGTARQQQAHATLHSLNLPGALLDFDPVLAGTIPLNIDVPGSDLDLICEVPAGAAPQFRQRLRDHYGTLPGFTLTEGIVNGIASTACNFRRPDFELEIFGQPRPVRQQHAYRHMVVEARVLALGGVLWQQAVRRLKAQGMKTEPAFAQLLGLTGDPYAALLTLEEWSDAALQALLERSGSTNSPQGFVLPL
ncbi:DUF4269 domain-containing protein [Hymenobacter sp. ASUV-10]|uniref:DUF4269 domain-containing protein n=1 Tax=Hymenobacter aranciens TaxID=3063996 RepID=A0ABT9B9V8_9BACT|nr:DUF4269 domain-containing protein [Hymenobacter sp. ASUV-10]MDO7873476.1 DUF4269 domain-containing protein [Hymenobacter sp. ASUV-10]